MIGSQIGSYRILEEIGHGGMATVYRAHQTTFDRFVAIKVIRHTVTRDEKTVQRFQREARLIARLEHPHILPVYDFDGTHDPPYIVMRYMDGGTLRDVLHHGHLPVDEIIQVTRQMGMALDYAHQQGIIHRDVKPSNIMVDREGNAFLSDLGIARITNPDTQRRLEGPNITETGAIVGTPDYMAPEQVMAADSIDHRVDVYALGVVAYQMMTGQSPYDGGSPMMIMLAHMKEPIPRVTDHNARLPEAVNAVMARAMAKTREDRYTTAGEFAEALEAVLQGSSTASSTSIRAVVTETMEMAQVTTLEFQETMPFNIGQAGLLEYQRRVTALVAEIAHVQDERLHILSDELAAVIERYGGQVMPQSGSTLTALWGLRSAHEDDPERAVRAGLRLLEAIREQTQDSAQPPVLRVAINTGPVTITTPEEQNEVIASGRAITLARQIAQHADSGLLIARDNFRQVSGLFDVEPEMSLRERDEDQGRGEVIPVYRVLGAKSRPYRIKVRGVEGIDTAQIGRRAEMEIMQKAFLDAAEDSETSAVTVIGAPGLGKSRLLREFLTWLELRPEQITVLHGRATPATQHRPYALLRDLLSTRFELHDGDGGETLRAKLESGVQELTGLPAPDLAGLLAYLCGFELTSAPKNTEQTRERARRAFSRVMMLAARRQPVIIELEDIHHGDDASLDLIAELLNDYRDLPLLLLAAARSDLFIRRPDWGRGHEFHRRVQLQPLDRRDSRDLASEILKHVRPLPRELRDLLVERAEGNPYYMEELVKLLIEDRIIRKESDPWQVEDSRLKNVAVPPTLIGLLQARLDTLLYPERILLQRAAVIGRVFYDQALLALGEVDGLDPGDIDNLLDLLVAREFIFRRESSHFEGCKEYVFAQTLVRDMIEESLLDEQRRAYNLRAAHWLIHITGHRISEFAGLLADFYEQAGEAATAVGALRKAGEQAVERGAFRDALTAYSRAAALIPDDAPTRPTLLVELGDVRRQLGELDSAEKDISSALRLAREMPELEARERATVEVDALRRLGLIAQDRGDFESSRTQLESALEKARALNEPERLILTLQALGITRWQMGDLEEAVSLISEMQALAAGVNKLNHRGNANNLLGIIRLSQGRYDDSRAHFSEMRTLARDSGNIRHEIIASINLGEIDRLQGNFEAARDRFVEGLLAAEEHDFPQQSVICLMNLGDVLIQLDDLDEARRYLVRALGITQGMGAVGLSAYVLSLFGRMHARRGDPNRALELLGLVQNHPASDEETRQEVERVLTELRTGGISEEALTLNLERGAALDMSKMISQLLENRTDKRL